jgi:hypothetical protein
VYRHTNAVTGEIIEHVLRASRTDVFTGKTHRAEGDWYRAGKRQLSREELKRHGLVND